MHNNGKKDLSLYFEVITVCLFFVNCLNAFLIKYQSIDVGMLSVTLAPNGLRL